MSKAQHYVIMCFRCPSWNKYPMNQNGKEILQKVCTVESICTVQIKKFSKLNGIQLVPEFEQFGIWEFDKADFVKFTKLHQLMSAYSHIHPLEPD